jgi:4-amino-4-deoxy-L-arabinose transferase-like glycosyltransferase
METASIAAGPAERGHGRLRSWLRRRRADRRTPLVLLGVVCLLGVGVRAYHLEIPASAKPGQGYVFDERYYVSAARVIAGSRHTLGDVYAGASPAGTDPNAEHGQVAKLIIAASIDVFGDNTVGWRLTAVVFGAAAILLLYWLVRCAGGSQWLALGAAGLASFDNLWVVHSRIAVLDIYVVPFMLAGIAFYLRRRPIVAGCLLGIGCCVKEFAVYGVFIIVLLELMQGLRRFAARRSGDGRAVSGSFRRGLLRATTASLVAGVSFFTLLAALDAAVTPYSGGHRVDRNQASICRHLLIWQGSCNHFVFIDNYAARLRDIGHPRGIAAAPTNFWLDRKAINYYGVTRTVTKPSGARSTEPILSFRGEINRVLLVTSWFAILLCLWLAVRRRDETSFLVLAWILGTWLPPELFHVIDSRTTYLYYMVVTMPAVYIAVARLLAVRRLPVLLVGLWVAGFIWDFVSLYPLRTLSGM